MSSSTGVETLFLTETDIICLFVVPCKELEEEQVHEE